MATLRVGDVQITRVEESYGPGFRASMLMQKFDLDAVENHGPDVFARFMPLLPLAGRTTERPTDSLRVRRMAASSG